MTHYIHACTKMPEGVIESLQENYGYDLAELPLNMDVSSHEKNGCPYCHATIDQMKPLDGRRTKMLSGQSVR